MWWYVIAMVVSTAISYAMRPQPEQPKALALDDIKTPTIDKDRHIAAIFGTVTIEGPHVHWYGHLDTDPVRADEL